VCEGGGVRPPPRERVSRAVAEGRRAECVCEAESELESVGIVLFMTESGGCPAPKAAIGVKDNEQALVSLKLKKSVDAEVGRTFAVIIKGG